MLAIKNVSKQFGNKQILDKIQLTIQDGEIVAIVGPSGGGKTTLLRCICGLETMDEGELWIDGEPVDPLAHEPGINRIGIVFQDFNLFPHKSVLENVMLAPMKSLKLSKVVAKERALEVLTSLEIDAQASHYPFELSGGQKQRVAIARALVMQPKVLCYDEPTSALDPALRDNVAHLITGLKKSKISQIIVTHDHEFARNVADQLIEVGKIN